MTQPICKSLDEALYTYGLDFEVKKTPIFTNCGGLKKYDGRMAMTRTDTKEVIGLVSSKYPEVNPSEKFQCFDAFAKEGIIEFTGGGTYGGGSKVYLQARLPNSINVKPEVGDIIERRIIFHSSYDGSVANDVANYMLRLVCSNGATRSITEMESKFKNTKNSSHRFLNVAELLRASIENYKVLDQLIQSSLQTREYTDRELKKFIEMVLPTPANKEASTRLLNRRLVLEETIHHGIGQDVIEKMNSYKLLQGALAYTQHDLSANSEDPFEYVSFGAGSRINNRVMNIIEQSISNPMIFSN